eukprot:TRINITY_DN13728_c0_g1_i3.p1 TRINITY_DN13728_c0_g1~~TRINITY_DN13728_c0_g1_i3.p1  ORF type:complete len:303 (-),score=49.24 TRINITY_DN13728_c0_g1_i3:235-1143(-)
MSARIARGRTGALHPGAEDYSCRITEALMACSFPGLGMLHFAGRPSLWKEVVCPIIVTIFSTAISLYLLLKYVYHPQALILQDRYAWPRWAALPGSAALLVLEVSLSNMIVFLVLFGCTQSRIARRVLEERGVLPQLRAELGHEVREATVCADCRHSIAFLLARLPLLLLTLPLNGVPVAGQVAWLLLNGWLYAWELTAEFMVALEDKRSCGDQWRFVRRRLAAYVGFGTVAMALELIPLFGPWIFFGSNACGAAFLVERIFSETHIWENGQWRPGNNNNAVGIPCTNVVVDTSGRKAPGVP